MPNDINADDYGWGYDQGYRDGCDDGYTDGWRACQAEYEEQLARLRVEIVTMQARVAVLQRKM